MTKRAVLYARVSSEGQAKGESASIDQQIADMQALCERNGWEVLDLFVDCENYRATQAPRKGKVVNPSGESAARSRLSMPLFLHPWPEVRLSDTHTAGSYLEERLREIGLKA